MKKIFYSNGKLLLTGEYLVLDGAIALALPTKFGQNLVVENVDNNKLIHWKSYNNDGSLWFETYFSFKSIINNIKINNQSVNNALTEILHQSFLLNSSFIKNATGYFIQTHLTFPRNWGLGTSSTLINNIAEWVNVDAYVLLKNSFGGSGYDIACAKNNAPILYQLKNYKPFVSPINFNPLFKEHIYFVYLNKKSDSQNAIRNYRKKIKNIDNVILKINQITHQICLTNDFNEFSKVLQLHETILSSVLDHETIQKELFFDFNGVVKSLGAWGGDFVMVISKESPTKYFNKKGFNTVFKYDEIIL